MKFPFVFSFPRSGLHLTSTIIGLELFVNFKLMNKIKNIINKIKENKNQVLFTHKTSRMLDFDCINFILNETKPIFLLRDPKDAITSWYYLLSKSSKKNINSYEFITSPFRPNPEEIEYNDKILLWKDHVRGYRKYENKLHIIVYENLVNNFEKEREKLSNYVGFEVKKQMPSLQEVKMSRKGKIGDYKNLLNEELIEKINITCEQETNYIKSFLY